MLVAAIGILTQFGAKAQYVRERPRHDVVEVRPGQPTPRHLWREGEWEWRGGAYVWVPGQWIVPPHGHMWIAGHWRRGRGGWVWVGGHWR
jgi:hypothetical protein